jgi:hypothetical protein
MNNESLLEECDYETPEERDYQQYLDEERAKENYYELVAD